MTISTVYPNKSQVSQASDLSGLKGLPLWFGRMRQVSLRGRGLWGLAGVGGGEGGLHWDGGGERGRALTGVGRCGGGGRGQLEH